MVWRAGLLVFFAIFAAMPAHAGIIFNRHSKQPAKPNTQDPTAELIRTARVDPDERRRATAVEELGKYDLRQYPQAGAALIEVLRSDSSAGVRIETAQALGRMRPLTQQVAEALDLAFGSDSSVRVRQAARSSLTPFLQAGYKPGQRSEPQADRPNYAGPVGQPLVPTAPAQLPSPFVRRSAQLLPPANETGEPPLADASPVESAKAAIPSRPLGAAPANSTIPPVQPPLATEEPKAPASKPASKKDAKTNNPAKPEAEGPILIPPE